MPMIKCPDCQKIISSHTSSCPNCGCQKEFYDKDFTFETLALDPAIYPRESFYSEFHTYTIRGFYITDIDPSALIRQIIQGYVCAKFYDDVIIENKKMKIDPETGEYIYTVSGKCKTWSLEEIRKQSPGQIIRRALAIYTRTREDCFAIKELAAQPDDQLVLLNMYRDDPAEFRNYYYNMKEKYSVCCPECGLEYIALPEAEYNLINPVRNSCLTGPAHCPECKYTKNTYFSE